MAKTLGETITGPIGRLPEKMRLALTAGPLGVVGALHIPPKTAAVVDRLIPGQLPGGARAWTIGSGIIEVATAAALLNPGTRRAAALFATALLGALWVGNIKMAYDWRDKPVVPKAIAFARVPLQIPMMQAAWSLKRG